MRAAPVLVLLLAAAPAHAGVKWISEHRTTGGGTPLRVAIALEGTRARWEILDDSGGGRVLLFDSATRKVTLLSAARKSFLVLPPPHKPSAEERDRLEKALKKLPADVRARLEARRATPPPPKALHFEKTGKTLTVAGVTCEVTRVLDGTVALEEDCLVPWGKGGATKEELAAAARLADVLPSPPPADDSDLKAPVVDAAALPGFPMVREVLDSDGTSRSVETITRFERAAIPDAELAVPAGWVDAATSR
jgi:hypothetical protein